MCEPAVRVVDELLDEMLLAARRADHTGVALARLGHALAIAGQAVGAAAARARYPDTDLSRPSRPAAARRIRPKKAEAVALAKLHPTAQVDQALCTAAIAGRFTETN